MKGISDSSNDIVMHH